MNIAMLPNYLKTARRSLQAQRLYAAINVGGLAIGLACSMLILLYVRHELSYERFNEGRDRVFRLIRSDRLVHPAALVPVMQHIFPEAEAVARTAMIMGPLIGRGDHKTFHEALFVEPELFGVLDIPFVRGDRDTALEKPWKVAISTELARVYFGDEDPMG